MSLSRSGLWISGTHVVEGENRLQQDVLCLPHRCWGTPPHPYIITSDVFLKPLGAGWEDGSVREVPAAQAWDLS